MKYIIPDIPKSNNQYIGRSNIQEYQMDKKMWNEMIWGYCRPRPPKPFEKAIVVLTYHFTDSIRRDPDNYSGKMLLDGLVKNEIIKDDSFFCVRLILDAEFGCPKKETVIEVIEVLKMTEEQLCEAMERECPVMGMTILNGEIEYKRVLGVIKRKTDVPGKYGLFAELESNADYVQKPVVYPAERIRLKEF